MIRSLFKYLLCAFALSLGCFAQERLTVEDAIKIGLEKNFSVLIVKNQQEIAKLQNNIGDAGMSPTVSLNSSYNFSKINSQLEFNTGAIQNRVGAEANNLGSSVNCYYTVYGERADTDKNIPEYEGTYDDYPGDNRQYTSSGDAIVQ
jgi:outer membrane protein TolC